MTLNANSQLSSALKLQRWLDKASVEVNSVADDKIKNKFNQYFEELVGLLDTVYDEDDLFEFPNQSKPSLDADFKSLVVEIPDDNEDVPVIDDNYDAGVDPDLFDEDPGHTPTVFLKSTDDSMLDTLVKLSGQTHESLIESEINDDELEQDEPQQDEQEQDEQEQQEQQEQQEESKGILDRISDKVETRAVSDFFASNQTDTDVDSGLDDIMAGVLDVTDIPIVDDVIEKSTDNDYDEDNDDDEDNGRPMTIDNVENY